jgi:hypothetical protein
VSSWPPHLIPLYTFAPTALPSRWKSFPASFLYAGAAFK